MHTLCAYPYAHVHRHIHTIIQITLSLDLFHLLNTGYFLHITLNQKYDIFSLLSFPKYIHPFETLA